MPRMSNILGALLLLGLVRTPAAAQATPPGISLGGASETAPDKPRAGVIDTQRLVGALRAVLGSTEHDFFLGGIQVNEPNHRHWVETLEAEGFDTVAVTVYARQGDWDSADLRFAAEEPGVSAEVQRAKAQGLRVVMVLRVLLDHAFVRNKFFWHGMIMPRSDAQLAAWFERYRRFAVRWAKFAAAAGIEVLAVGCELDTLTNTVATDTLPSLEEYWGNTGKVARENRKALNHARILQERLPAMRGGAGYRSLGRFLNDRALAHAAWARQTAWLGHDDPVRRINRRRRLLRRHWDELIAQVREVYSGALTYAASFNHYQSVKFWDRLDLLGINAYFPLRGAENLPSGAAQRVGLFARHWKRILTSIRDFRTRRRLQQQRVLFTELGYVRSANSTIEPWVATGFSVLPTAAGNRLLLWEDQPEDRSERAQAVRGLYQAHRALGESLLAGILYWKLSTMPAHEAIEPFVLIIGDPGVEDPLLVELKRFATGSAIARWKRYLATALGALLRGSGTVLPF